MRHSACTRHNSPRLSLMCLLALMLTPIITLAQPGSGEDPQDAESPNSAAITIDGSPLFEVRGIRSYPATERAKLIRQRIIDTARDDAFSLDQLKVTESEDRTSIYAGDTLITSVFDLDGEFEGIKRHILARVYRDRIANAISEYRTARTTPVLLRNSAYALTATALFALLLWATIRLSRQLDGWAQRHLQRNLEALADKSHQLIRASQVWTLVAALLRGLRFLSILLLVYFYLNGVLGLYPWTRPIAFILFDLVLNPLESLWRGLLGSIPDLMFLVILFFVVRYLLKVTRLFFNGIHYGRIRLQNFDRDWALPTYKIVRVLVVAFALVVAYPYIPGSDSLAFKGVSLFLGVIVSLGSSSFIANMMAGLSMTYRGAFKEGDRIQIGEVIGRVEEIKLMITRVRTYKNEMVVIPNSNILNTNVVNYTALARKHGLVLHTTVSIGYDTPWRQVEAMLLEAAARTEGLKTEPKPFVLQLSLGDFAVSYELNAYCDDETRMPVRYSEMHANIQDVFNENGVQIMSPAYEADPATPKVVLPEHWYLPPAVKPES